jgi:hypothetical protein
MKTSTIFALVFAAALAVIAFVAGFNTGHKASPPSSAVLDSLANGWRQAEAQALTSKELAEKLTLELQVLGDKWKKAVNANVRLRLEIERITGGGPGEWVDDTQPPSLAQYEDKIVQLRYHIFDNQFDYEVKPRGIIVSVVSTGEKVAAQAYDPDLDRVVPISNLDYAVIKPKARWWKNIHLGPGVGWDQDGWKVGIKPGVYLVHLPIEARMEKEGIKWSVSLYRDLW